MTEKHFQALTLAAFVATLAFLPACSKTNFSSEKSSSSNESASATPTPIPAKDPAQAKADCEWFKLGIGFLADPLADNSSVDGLVGSGIYSASHVTKINAVTGSVIVLGTTPNASIDLLSNIEGSALICDLDVHKVTDVAGSVIVVSGVIGAVDDVTGSVLTIDGSIQGPVTRSTGSVLAF